MSDTRLDDAEAMRNLWDETAALARETRRLTDAAERLSVLTRRFASSYVFIPIEDPRPLLVQLGAALDLCDAVAEARRGIEDAIKALDFAFKPSTTPNRAVQAKALAELKVRVVAARPPTPDGAP